MRNYNGCHANLIARSFFSLLIIKYIFCFPSHCEFFVYYFQDTVTSVYFLGCVLAGVVLKIVRECASHILPALGERLRD